MRMMNLLAAAALAATLPFAALAEGKTLADIRAELSALAKDIQGLRAELVASGPEGMKAAGGVTALDRLNSMEAALAQLTGQTEAIQNKIDRVVTDGTNRLGDLEFRLCEMDEGCDLGALGDTPPLGQPGAGASPDALSAPKSPAAPAAAPAAKPATPQAGAPLQAGEQAELDRAKEVLGQGDFRKAADLLAAFAQARPQSPLMSEARWLQGRALAGAGETKAAADAWLDGFSGDPSGLHAADSLLALGRALAELGSKDAACLSLAEVGTRFPGSGQAKEAETARASLTCE